jgi:cytochrome c oxidase cbb3-type subunit 4
MDYQTLRTFADTWGLVGMAAVFALAVLWALRRGKRAQRALDEAAAIPLNDDRPLDVKPVNDKEGSR